MRISTRMIYDQGSSQLNNLQGALNRTQMQLSANRRNLTPADDPIASARALEVTQSQSINTQFVTNRSNAKNFLSQEELALGNTGSLIADVKDLVVKAGNPALKDVDRDTLAKELEGRLTDLLGIANTADGAGGYLFSGYKSTTQPFSQTPTGATYVGDQGQRELQVGSARYLATSDSGATVFENNLTGNGKFTTAAATANFTRGGSGIISGGTVTDATALTGHKYSIDFKVAGTGTAASPRIPSPTPPWARRCRIPPCPSPTRAATPSPSLASKSTSRVRRPTRTALRWSRAPRNRCLPP